MNPAPTPLQTAEFLAVDVETNGLPSDRCELTEVGAVVVGGGELHDRFESLVRVERPLGRGIQRFTGITQAMVDEAPEPAEVLRRVESLLAGRVLVAHSASFDRGVLRGAFERCGVEWPDPPVLCTVALARRLAPLATKRRLAPLAATLGIEVDRVHRALPDAETCARIFCALFPKLCAHAPTVADAVALAGPQRRRRARAAARAGAPARARRGAVAARHESPPPARRPRGDRPDLTDLPHDPGVYVFRDLRGKPLYVGKSVAVRTRARSHFTTPAGWTGRAESVDYRPANSELGALVLENRLIKAMRPPGNKRLKHTDGYVFLRARLDIPFPVLEVAPQPAAGLAVNVGPMRGKAAAEELAGQLNSLFALRHCGRAMRRRDHPSAYGQMGRCLSPCLGDLDPNLYRSRLDQALALFDAGGDAGDRLLAHIEQRMHAAAAEQRYERAEVLRRRLDRIGALLGRLGGVLRATHASSRLVIAPHPSKPRFDAFWLVAGRVVDWGPLPASADEVAARSAAARARRAGGRTAVPLAELDEVRIVAAWLAAHEPPELALEEAAAGGAALREFLRAAAAAPPGVPV